MEMTTKEAIQKLEKGEITWDNVYDLKIIDNKNPIKEYIGLKNAIQQSLKVTGLNAEFGFLDNKYNPIGNRNISGSITYLGRLLNKVTARNIRNYIEEKYGIIDSWVYSDTDSFYIKFDKYVDYLLEKQFDGKEYNDLEEEKQKELVDKLVDFINDEIQPIVDSSVDFVQKKFNAYQKGFMGAKIEKIVLSGLWTAKKRYALLKLWDEGSFFLKTKLAVTGIEVVKSSTPDFSIEKLTEALIIMLSGTEEDLQKFVKETKKEFIEVARKNPAAISVNSRVNNLTKYKLDNKGLYYINEQGKRIGAPENTKSAINHNNLLEALNIDYIQPIEAGTKIYIIKLKKPNKFDIDVIGFQDERILFDTGLIDFIDIENMWEKSFLSALRIISDAINWNLIKKKKIDLSGW